MATLAVVVCAALLLRSHPTEKGAGNGADTTPMGQSLSVPVTAPGSNSKTDTSDSSAPLTLLGTVQPLSQATLSVRQPSRIVGVYVKDGQHVMRGQLLALFDTTEAVPQEQGARAGIVAAETQVDRARAGREAQRIKAASDVASAQAGLKLAQEKLGQAQLGVESARASDRADLVTAQEGVHKAEIGLQNAQKQLQSLVELDQVGGVARNDLEGARRAVQVAESDLELARAAVRRLHDGPKQGTPSASKSNEPEPKVVDSLPTSGTDGPGGIQEPTTYRVAAALRDEAQARIGVSQAEAGLTAARDAQRQIERVASADIASASAGVQQAQAGLAGIRTGQQNARLNSPVDGVATGVTARLGEIAQPGVGLVTIVTTAGAHVEALVPARLLPRLHTGQHARVLTETRPDAPLSAIISTIATVAEPDGRTFRVTLRLPNASFISSASSASSDYRIGQSVHIIIPLTPPTPTSPTRGEGGLDGAN